MSARRGHGEGSIYQDPTSGRWVAEISGGYGPNGRRKRIKRKARTKSEAREKLRELQRQVEDGLPPQRADIRIGELCDVFVTAAIESRSPAPKTLENYRWAIDGHLKPGLGRRKLSGLTVDEVEAFLFAKRDDGLSKNSLNRLRTVLKAAITEAERKGWVNRNVASLARTPDAPTKKRRSLTEDEARALLEAARGTKWEAAILIGLTRGLRPGEILGLRWSDLDLEAEPPTLMVTGSLKSRDGVLEIGDPKTPRSRRTLQLSTEATAALRRHRKAQTEQRLTVADVWSDLDLVFSTEIGTPIDPSNFRREFRKLTEAAGIGYVPPYSLRHSAASQLAAAGVPMIELVDLLGHTDARTLMSVYRQPLGGPVDAGASALCHTAAT